MVSVNVEPRPGTLDTLLLRSEPGDGPCNEDRAGATARAAWVIDGATGLGESLLPHASDAGWFAEALDAAMAEEGSSIPWEQVKADLGWG